MVKYYLYSLTSLLIYKIHKSACYHLFDIRNIVINIQSILN